MHGFIWAGPAELWRTYPLTYPPPRRKCRFKHTAAFASLLPSVSIPTLAGQRTPQTHLTVHSGAVDGPTLVAASRPRSRRLQRAWPSQRRAPSPSLPHPPSPSLRRRRRCTCSAPANLCPAGGGVRLQQGLAFRCPGDSPPCCRSFCTVYSARASCFLGLAWSLGPCFRASDPSSYHPQSSSVLYCGRSTSATLPFTAYSRWRGHTPSKATGVGPLPARLAPAVLPPCRRHSWSASLAAAGRWFPGRLLAFNACVCARAATKPARTAEEEATLRRARGCRQIAQGDLSRARAALTASPLSPGTAATLESLVDPARRPPALLRPIPDHISNYCPDAALHLSEQEVVDALRTAKRSAAPGLSGATAEHFRLLLDDGEALTLFTGALTQLANAHVPPEVLTAISQSRFTALAKPGGGARGIATGDSLRRLTSRIWARKFAATFDVATRPYQFALQTRAGIDALAGLLRAAVDLDPRTAVVSFDDNSAYDCVSRSAIFTALHITAPALVPFVRAIYGTPSIGGTIKARTMSSLRARGLSRATP